MRIIKAEPIQKDTFSPFGVYSDMFHPDGYSLNGEIHRFFADRISESYQGRAAFSPLLVKKPSEMKITALEYHTTTPEIIFPMNDDMILHVAPPSAGTPVPEYTHAFLVPKGTMVKIGTAVWHLAPLPVHAEELCALIVLPECTYQRDCTVVNLSEDQQFTIVL